MAEITERTGEANSEDAIASIAQQMHYPLPIVRRVYEAELARLKTGARDDRLSRTLRGPPYARRAAVGKVSPIGRAIALAPLVQQATPP